MSWDFGDDQIQPDGKDAIFLPLGLNKVTTVRAPKEKHCKQAFFEMFLKKSKIKIFKLGSNSILI